MVGKSRLRASPSFFRSASEGPVSLNPHYEILGQVFSGEELEPDSMTSFSVTRYLLTLNTE